MKRIIIFLVVVCMISVSMSGVAFSETAPLTLQKKEINTVHHERLKKTQTDPDAIEHLEEAIDSYLRMDENSLTPYEKSETYDANLPWIGIHGMRGDFVSWWIRLKYNGQNFAQQLEISPENLRERFLVNPYYDVRLYFNIDDDSADDVEVRVGFYWRRYIDPDGDDPRGLEFKFIVTQTSSGNPGGGIADPYADLEVWSEISLNVGLIRNTPVNQPVQINSAVNKLVSKLFTYNINKLNSISTTLMKQLETIIFPAYQENTFNSPLNNPASSGTQNTDETLNADSIPLNDPQTSDTDDDYISMGAGYRSPQGSRIPQTVTKKFWFARSTIFSPTIFQHEFDPEGTDPIELLYGFQAYEGGHTTPDYNITFSVGYEPAVYLRTQVIPLKGYLRYYFLPKSKTSTETVVTFSSSILNGIGENIQLQLIFDEVDSSLAYSGRWFSFDFNVFDGFEYRASNKFTVSFQIVTPMLSEKIKLRGIPTSIDFHRRQWDIDFTLVGGQLLDLEVLAETKLIMNSNLDELILYYPKANISDPDLTLFKVTSIPSTETFSIFGNLDIINSTYLTVQADGYVDLSMSSTLSKVQLFTPKQNLLFEIAGIPARERVGAIGKVYYKRGDPLDQNNYVYGKAYRDFSGNLGAINFYLPGVLIPVVSITEIPADAWAEGKFLWSQIKGFGHAERQSQGAEDPIAVYLEFDQFSISNILEIRDGFIHTDFHIAQDGYFTLDTSNEMVNNAFEVCNLETENSLYLEAGTVAADSFNADWNIVQVGDQIQVQDLALSGELESFGNFDIAIELQGKNTDFNGYLDMGEREGGFEIDFSQAAPVTLDFDMDQFENFDLYGSVTLAQNIHFDMSWNLKEGTLGDKAFFYLNKNTNVPNIQQIDITATYNNQFGAHVTVQNIQLILSFEWWLDGNDYDYSLWWYVGTVTDVDLLWRGTWHDLI